MITDTLHATSRATPSGPRTCDVLAAAMLTLMAAAITQLVAGLGDYTGSAAEYLPRQSD